MRNLFVALTRNAISLIGTALAVASAVIIVTLFMLELVGLHGNPYVGILAYLVFPGFFALGLVLIPVGIWAERRKEQRAAERGELPARFPVIDLNQDRTRRLVLVFLLLTMVNLVILATATYKGVEVMDSTEFCGTTCHTVMIPEFTAYSRSPHARVECVACHIGPGADWFVKSKLSGAWQVVAVTFDLFPRPIPTPIENLRPARDTCEQCHWPSKFVGDRLKVITHYNDDEANSEMKTVLLLRVGGVEGRRSHGIHWHVDPGIRIRYRADESRETIYDVEMSLADGTVQTFRPRESNTEAAGEERPWRVMDCVDCHNRPTHIYRMPEWEVDSALQKELIDRSLPYVRREGLRLMRGDYDSHEQARDAIATGITAFYRENYPELLASRQADIVEAATVLGDLYCSNVFPKMNIEWGTYPDHLGHVSFNGCFRCHDDEHATETGEVISQDCDTCHSLLAMEESDPAILQELNP